MLGNDINYSTSPRVAVGNTLPIFYLWKRKFMDVHPRTQLLSSRARHQNQARQSKVPAFSRSSEIYIGSTFLVPVTKDVLLQHAWKTKKNPTVMLAKICYSSKRF